MTGAPSIPLPTPPRQRPLRETTRLWPALARPTRRAMPARGADLAGEWLVGVVNRARFRAGLRRRAERIIRNAATLASASERAFDDAVE